jgi:hypothetical protein
MIDQKNKKLNGCSGFVSLLLIICFLLFSGLLFFSCDDKPADNWEDGVYQCFDFKEGQNRSVPYDWPAPKFNIDNANFYAWEFRVIANASALYSFETTDSLDWLKGYVISDDRRRYDKNNKAIAWRSSQAGTTFDFAWYANHNYEKILPDEETEVLRYIKPGQAVFFSATYDIERKRVDCWVWKEGTDRDTQGIFKRFENVPYVADIFWLASPWFGGTLPPPYDMEEALCIDARLILPNGSLTIQ